MGKYENIKGGGEITNAKRIILNALCFEISFHLNPF